MSVKRKIYRIMSVIVAALTFCLFTACGNETADDSGRLKIIATLFPQYDFAKQITGDNADITLLLTPGSESHTYEPTPKDVSKIQQADVFLYIGGESEVWADEILESAQNKNLKIVRLMDYIEPVEEAHEDDGHEHEEVGYDEHIFTSLKNSLTLLDEICNAICEEDKENEELYRQNAAAYAEKISELDASFTDMVNSAERKTVVFGDRFPFAYFAKDYGLECHAAFSGCSSETEASSATISSLIDIVKKEEIPTVFYIEFSSQSIADKIAGASGAKTALLHSCHNISKQDLEKGTSYVDLMTQNYQNLSEALN